MAKDGFLQDNKGLLIGAATAAFFYMGMERVQWGDGFLATVFAGIALIGGAMSDMGKGKGILSGLSGPARSKGLQPGHDQFIAKNNIPVVGKETKVGVNEDITPNGGLPPTLNALKENKGQGRG